MCSCCPFATQSRHLRRLHLEQLYLGSLAAAHSGHRWDTRHGIFDSAHAASCPLFGASDVC